MSHSEKVSLICGKLGLKSISERIRRLSESQLDYILSPIERNILLSACPGSGKTEVVGIKAAFEIKSWQRKTGGMAVLTFTNNAASVIKNRITEIIGCNKLDYPHYVGTLDSWLLGYIANPFSFIKTKYTGKDGDFSINLVDNSYDNGFLHSYKTKYQYFNRGPIFANQFYWDLELPKPCLSFNSGDLQIDTTRNNNKIFFKKWQIDDLKTVKINFLRDGYCTFQDVEFLCFLLLKNPRFAKLLAKRFPLFIIDECQDLSWVQMQFLQFLKNNASVLHFVGDMNQAIYDFKKVDPAKVEGFCNDNQFLGYKLNENFRSSQSIVDLCDKLVGKTGTIGNINIETNPSCLIFPYAESLMTNLTKQFEDYLIFRGLDISKSAILTRNWNNVSHLRPCRNTRINSKQLRLAMAIYLWINKGEDKNVLLEAISLMGQFVSEMYFEKYNQSAKKLFCPEIISSPIKWRLFIAKIFLEIAASYPSMYNLNQNWKEWCQSIRLSFGKILRDHLGIIKSDLPVNFSFHDLQGKEFRVPDNLGDNSVINALNQNKSFTSKLLITTIHSVKGQTFDAIMVVSSKNKVGTKDGYWTQWLENMNSEATRLAYVASSRPKYLLIWAIPRPVKQNDIERLKKLGFVLLPEDDNREYFG